MKDSVRIGVVGAGVFGSYHAAKFAANPRADFVGVFDIDAERAGALAAQHGARAYFQFADLLKNVDGVVIAAPATLHYALALQALEAGKHLLVEKPLATTFAEADALVKRARARRRVLQVGHQERYVCDAAGIFDREDIPVRIECVRRGPHSGRCEDVSVAFDLMVHDIDIVQKLAGTEVSALRAQGFEDEISAEVVLANGCVVSLNACRSAPEAERKMVVVYRDGIVAFDFIKRKVKRGAKETDLSAADAPLALRDPLAHGADLFLKAIAGEDGAIVTGEDGGACVAWAAQIEEAAGLLHGADAARYAERMRA